MYKVRDPSIGAKDAKDGIDEVDTKEGCDQNEVSCELANQLFGAKSASPNIRQLSSSDLIRQATEEIGLREANLAKRD